MLEIKKVIRTYLSTKKTTSALMINGAWGTGKTHYFRNELNDFITNECKKEVRYISVNGVDSLIEFKKKLFYSVFSDNVQTQNNWKKFAEGFSNIIKSFKSTNKINDYSITTGLGDIISVFKFDQTNSNNSVICIDDIERISDKFLIKDFLGFINTEYIEHNNLKVILICDESKNQLTTPEYIQAKEKVVGRTIQFKPNIEELIESLFDNFKHSKDFFNVINNHKSFILSLVKNLEYTNLRTILFSLDSLEKIWQYIIPSNQLESYVEKQIISFTFYVADEFKQGHYSASIDKDEIPTTLKTHLPTMVSMGGETEQSEKPDKNTTYRKWITNQKVRYAPIPSIYYFIVIGYVKEDNLSEDIRALKAKCKKINENKSRNTFIGDDCIGMSNEKVNEELTNTINRMEKGEFTFWEFSRISHNFIYFRDLGFSYFEKYDDNGFNQMILTNLKNVKMSDENYESRMDTKNNQALKGGKYQPIMQIFDEFVDNMNFNFDKLKNNQLFQDWTESLLGDEEQYLNFRNKHSNPLVDYFTRSIDAYTLYQYIIDNLTNRNFANRLTSYSYRDDMKWKELLLLLQSYVPYTRDMDSYWLNSILDKVKNPIQR